MEGLEGIGSLFTDGLGAVVDGLSSLGSTIGGFFSDLASSIGGFFDGLADKIGGFFEWLLEGIGNLLEFLFVPEDFGSDIKAKLDEKFPFIMQISTLMGRFLDLGGSAEAPNFTFTYENTTVSIVNFDDFREFVPMVHLIISSIAWATFLFRLYKRLPSIIGGFHGI